jgi:hypothetical protein
MSKKATPKKATKPTATKAKPQVEKAKKLSHIDAAAKVLAAAKEPMNCKAMIEAMQAKGYWKSPNGKTPEATLYASILRNIGKGKEAKFVKADRGTFKLNR